MSLRIFWISLFLFCALSCLPLHASVQDDPPAITARVNTLIAADDYAGLDALARKYRNPRERTSDGHWKLAVFYRAFFDHFSFTETDPAVWDTKMAWARAWTTARPKSAAAHNVMGRALLSRGLSYRGQVASREVPEENWAPYLRYAGESLEYLLAHRSVASVDPYYYATLANAAHRNDWSVDAFMAVFDEGAARHPQYLPLYIVPVNTYFARQYGGTPELVEAFARHALTKVPAKDRASLYARIYMESWKFTGESPRSHQLVEWPLVTSGMDDILARYPSQNNFQTFAHLSCMAQDRGKSVALQKHITTPPDLQIWGHAEVYRLCGLPILPRPRVSARP
jgi:hypothetical protein